jgi:hypothetical protein
MEDRRRAWTASLIYVVGTCCPGTVYVTAAATMQWFPRRVMTTRQGRLRIFGWCAENLTIPLGDKEMSIIVYASRLHNNGIVQVHRYGK